MITTEAFVLYKYCVYRGFDRNEMEPGTPSSILDNLFTVTFASPSIRPLSSPAICMAVYCIILILILMSANFVQCCSGSKYLICPESVFDSFKILNFSVTRKYFLFPGHQLTLP